MLITTESVVERSMQADLRYTEQRMGVIAQREGNPFGIAIQKFGHATALAASQLPSTRFNRVVGLTPEEAPALPEILARFAEREVSPQVETRPGGSGSAAKPDLVHRAIGNWRARVCECCIRRKWTA